MLADILHPTQYKFRHYTKTPDGRDHLLWGSGIGDVAHHGIHRGDQLEVEAILDQLWTPNALADGGEQAILDVFFRAGAAPTFAFRLYNDTPIDTDTLSTLVGEVSGSGYGGISVARNTTDWPSLALDGGDYKVTSATKTFTATGAWTAATQLVLASVTSGTAGTFYAWAPLSQSRTLGNGDSLDVTMGLKAA